MLVFAAVLCGRALADTTVGGAVAPSGRDRSLVYRPDENEVSRFEPDQTLCAAMDTRLWTAPGAGPLGAIRLGREVVVLSVREPLVRHELRLDRWYEVRVPGDSPAIGWMFGGALTLIIIRLRLWPLPAALAGQEWAQRLHRADAGVPYGIALAAAALVVYPDTIWMQTLK